MLIKKNTNLSSELNDNFQIQEYRVGETIHKLRNNNCQLDVSSYPSSIASSPLICNMRVEVWKLADWSSAEVKRWTH